jgi:membrane protein implicated in regulation of membrane protease activity
MFVKRKSAGGARVALASAVVGTAAGVVTLLNEGPWSVAALLSAAGAAFAVMSVRLRAMSTRTRPDRGRSAAWPGRTTDRREG